MTRALVLMKAMPPTKGHERLIRFAKSFSEFGVVVMDYAPDEPMIDERSQWLFDAVYDGRGWTEYAIPLDDQDPKSDGFWERWKSLLDTFGNFDYVVGSEPYCAKVAEVIGARYIPYDPGRELTNAKATEIRKSPISLFRHVATDFQPHLQTTVTVWGAESTGKTTLSKRLASCLDGEWVFEWARPYLEGTGQTVADLQAMHEIWHGQYAVENNARVHSVDKPFIVRDTDLYSTIGYWEQPHWTEKYGLVPKRLISDAAVNKADLYIITQSNIPFEKDPLDFSSRKV
jgi:HTH-type transcriptional repressor of NAD biosynthesis genes